MEKMWQLSNGGRTVRLSLPGQPVEGVPEPTVLRAQMKPRHRRRESSTSVAANGFPKSVACKDVSGCRENMHIADARLCLLWPRLREAVTFRRRPV